jgi:hypothetical protein
LTQAGGAIHRPVLLWRPIGHHPDMQSAITPSSLPPVPDIDQELREVQLQIEQRNFDDALHSSDRLLSHFPGHRDLLYMRAVSREVREQAVG